MSRNRQGLADAFGRFMKGVVPTGGDAVRIGRVLGWILVALAVPLILTLISFLWTD
jgi:hypothetical protein